MEQQKTPKIEEDWRGELPALEELRVHIDLIDNQILDLLNERARWVLLVGKVKRAQGLPIHVPSREHIILERLRERNRGPLTDETVVRLYDKIIEAFRRLEGELET